MTSATGSRIPVVAFLLSLVGVACLAGAAPAGTVPLGFLIKWGSVGSGDGQFIVPRGLVADAFGNVYVADMDNHRIRKFNCNGSFLTKWGSQGATDGLFRNPTGLRPRHQGVINHAFRLDPDGPPLLRARAEITPCFQLGLMV